MTLHRIRIVTGLLLVVIFTLALLPQVWVSSFQAGHWTLTSTMQSTYGGGTGFSVSTSGSSSGDIYVDAQGSVTGTGTFQGTTTITISGVCTGGGTYAVTENDQYSGQANSTGWANVVIKTTASTAPATVTGSCPDPPNPPLTESLTIPGNSVSGGGMYLMQLTTSAYTQDFPFPAPASGDFKFTVSPSSIAVTTNPTTNPTTGPGTPVEDIVTNGGSATVTNGVTGAPETSGTLSPGDIIQTGNGSVIGMTCPRTVVCPPGTVPVEFGPGTSAGLLSIQGTSADDLTLNPNDPAVLARLHTKEYFDSVSTAKDWMDMMAKFIHYGFERPPAETVAGEHIAAVIDDGISHYALQEFKAGVHNLFVMLTPDGVYIDRGTEYTLMVSPDGTGVDVFNGSVIVGSLATGQIASVGTGQRLFIPRDPALASQQNLTQDVEAFDPASVSHWWVTSSASALSLPGWLTMANEGLALMAASVILLVASVPLFRRRGPPKG